MKEESMYIFFFFLMFGRILATRELQNLRYISHLMKLSFT